MLSKIKKHENMLESVQNYFKWVQLIISTWFGPNILKQVGITEHEKKIFFHYFLLDKTLLIRKLDFFL